MTSSQPGQLFCSTQHRIDFQTRMRVRGRQLLMLELAVMATRQGRIGDREVGVDAARTANRLKRRWLAEDRKAGRMEPDAYLRQMLKHHDLPL